MANTLAEMALLSGEELKVGIIETIIKESPVMGLLPFKEVSGTAHAYNFETEMAGAGYYAPGDVWVESTGKWEKRTTALTILGGDADVDYFMKSTLSNKQQIAAPVIAGKAKALAHAFENSFLYGGTTVQAQANEFQGVLQYIAECDTAGTATVDLDGLTNTQVMAMGATSTKLTLAALDELIDRVKPGAPQCLMMSRRMRRLINALARAAGSALVESHGEFGNYMVSYNGIPIIVSDFILDNVPNGNGASVLTVASYDRTVARVADYDNSFILALQFGDNALIGLQSGGGIQTEYIGTLQDKDAERTRLKWYTGLCLESLTKCAVMINVIDA